MKKVSVIIPVYNTGKYLADCLECMINQTLKDIEIICVNDGSTDRSETIIKEYKEKYSNIILVNQNNLGQSAARNKALSIATGKYIYCMDSDDILLATALEELWNVSENKNLDVLYFSGTTFYQNNDLEKERTDLQNQYFRKGKYVDVCDGKNFLIELYKHNDYMVSPCLQFLRREFLVENDIKFYEGIIHEDNLFSFQIVIKAKKVFCINDIFFYRRVRENSVMTRKESSANLKGYYICLMEQMKISSDEEFNGEQKEAVLRLLRGLLYHVKRLYNSIDKEEKVKFLDECENLERYIFEVICITDIEEVNNWKRKYNADMRVKGKLSMGYLCVCSVPQKLKTCIRIYQEYGLSGVLRVIRDKIK